MQKKAVLYDKGGDKHYDYISAWIKATRGSDVDASLYYLAVMLEGGEDPRFIARRMIVLASEDIGNADPQALQVAVAAAHAVEHVGMPECALNLSQAAAYLALAPKSNASTKAIARARADVREQGAADPPLVPSGRALLRRPEAGARRRLRVPARAARRRVGPAAAAGGPGGPPLLRADRPRVRGRAARTARRCAPKAAQKRRIATTLNQPMRSIRQQAGIGHAFVCPQDPPTWIRRTRGDCRGVPGGDAGGGRDQRVDVGGNGALVLRRCVARSNDLTITAKAQR